MTRGSSTGWRTCARSIVSTGCVHCHWTIPERSPRPGQTSLTFACEVARRDTQKFERYFPNCQPDCVVGSQPFEGQRNPDGTRRFCRTTHLESKAQRRGVLEGETASTFAAFENHLRSVKQLDGNLADSSRTD
jgi:hypothetical protein